MEEDLDQTVGLHNPQHLLSKYRATATEGIRWRNRTTCPVRVAVFSLPNQLASAPGCSRCPLHPSQQVRVYDIAFRIHSTLNRETRARMAGYWFDFHFRYVSRHRSLYGGQAVADPRPLGPFIESRTHKGCVILCVGCLETRK